MRPRNGNTIPTAKDGYPEDFGHRLLGVVLRILMDAIDTGSPPNNVVRIGALGTLIQESVNRMLAVEHDMAEMRKRAH